MSVSTYKTLYSKPHINESLVSTIIAYCLNYMNNSDKTFSSWHVGICKTGFTLQKDHFKTWDCSSVIEAEQTKDYLVTERKMVDEGAVENGTTIYVFLE